MKIAVVGSRNYKDSALVIRYMGIIQKYHGDNALVITGGARGVDAVVEAEAKMRGLAYLVIPPNYEKYGRKAPLIRNSKIVKWADIVVAFWDGKSTGTLDVIRKAKKLGKLKKIYRKERN